MSPDSFVDPELQRMRFKRLQALARELEAPTQPPRRMCLTCGAIITGGSPFMVGVRCRQCQAEGRTTLLPEFALAMQRDPAEWTANARKYRNQRRNRRARRHAGQGVSHG
jgi:hypothetical protein